MREDKPLVSYVIAAYNHEKYVKQTIDSVLNQTYDNIEIIVCDDCSSDGTYAVLDEYKNQNKITLLKNEENMGTVRTVNRLIKEANGKYIAFLASDDWLKPEKTEREVEFIISNGLDAVLSPVINYYQDTDECAFFVDEETVRRTNYGDYLNLIYENKGFLVQSGLFLKSAVDAIGGGFLEEYKADDILFMLRFTQSGFSVGCINEFLVYYRNHGENTYKNAEYTLKEYTIPVIRDFVPSSFQPQMYAIAYDDAAKKCVMSGELIKGWKYEIKSSRYNFCFKRLVVFLLYPIYNIEKIRVFYNKHFR